MLSFGSDAFAAKLTESEKSLEAARAEVSSFKEQLARLDTEKADSSKLLVQAREELEMLMLCLSIAIVGRNLAENLTRLLVSESDNEIEAVVQ